MNGIYMMHERRYMHAKYIHNTSREDATYKTSAQTEIKRNLQNISCWDVTWIHLARNII
jgi:hypothetical protein